MSSANDLGGPNIGSSTAYGGPTGAFGSGTTVVPQANPLGIPYTGGYQATFGGSVLTGLINGVPVLTYTGYNTGFAANITINTPVTIADLNPVAPHPKTQTIYYKLAGFNTGTQQLENWIISEEIVPRPELFDPTRSPPNVDLSVFLTPPSGHNLVNIKIVARWIQ